MSNATLLNVIAASHAMSHAAKGEAWLCECIGCKFTKEYKLTVQREDGSLYETTVADVLLENLEKEGYHTFIPTPACL